jgi:hypothetical protein
MMVAKVAWGRYVTLALLSVGWLLLGSPIARADTITDGCIEDRAGSDLNCTANDVRIATAHAENITNDCTDADGIATFDLVVDLKSGPDRYDIGAYFATDNGDARNGTCQVSDMPTSSPFADFDDDECGDIAANTTIAQNVGSLTVPCSDDDGNQQLDLGSCLSWDNQSSDNCEGAADAIPSTKSKCRCEPINVTNIPVPPAECEEDSDCGDGLFCNGSETCDASGNCQPGPAPCSDDGDACNGVVTCDEDNDVCDPGSAVDCNDGNSCTQDSCDPTDGSCTNDGAPLEGTTCDDGEACTSDGGTPGNPDECRSGTCTGDPVNCSDGDACTGIETCVESEGGCQPGTPVSCGDGNACNGTETCDPTDGSCDPGTPIVCDDGNACNGTETCDPSDGSCDSSAAPDCNDDNPCTEDECDPSSGNCTNDGAPLEGTPCDDELACTSDGGTPGSGDACHGGECHGDPVDCNDDNACTGTETCDPSDGSCDSTGAPDCNDDNPCTQDGCNSSTGACTNDGAPLEGQPCDDDLICTSDSGDPGPDACRSGQCHGGEVDCDDDDVCTDDSCNETDGCVNEPTGGSVPGTAEGDARAYGLSLVFLDAELIEPQPDSNDTNPYEAAAIPVDPLARVSLLNGSESENITAESAETSAEAETGRVLLLDQTQGIGPIRLWTVTAKAVRTSSSSQADGNGASSTGECELANVKILGLPTLAHVSEPVAIPVVVPGVGKVTVNLCEKIPTGAAAGETQPAADGTTSSGLTVNAIHVSAVAGGTTLLDLVVAHSESDAAFGTVCEQLADVSGEACVAELKVDEEILDPDNQLLGTDVGCVKLPSTGSDGEDATLAHVGPLGTDAGLLLESNTAFSHTDGTPSGGSNSHAQVEDLDLLKVGADPALITADLVRSECTARPDGTVTADTEIANLAIAGTNLIGEFCTQSGDQTLCHPPENFTIEIPGLLKIVLNEQFDTGTADKAEITVNAIHVYALGGDIPASLDLIVSRSKCDVKKAASPE